MVIGRIVVSIEVIKLMNSTVEQLGISASEHSKQLEEICKFALNRSREEKKERKRVKVIIQETLVFLQEKCDEVDYIDERFFQGLIQLVGDL
ncbi:MAG: hypothetical protein K1060chlam4_00384 [Candidatus Anoxychlamydiales bacterium]|nr:hypothetical protein [Candidatus Anoxychlamydiales bacterium]